MIDVSIVANKIADEIEARGHWQGQEINENDEVTPCCIVTSDAYWQAGPNHEDQIKFKKALAAKAGFLWVNLYEWNDSTPTDKVLDTLRSL